MGGRMGMDFKHLPAGTVPRPPAWIGWIQTPDSPPAWPGRRMPSKQSPKDPAKAWHWHIAAITPPTSPSAPESGFGRQGRLQKSPTSFRTLPPLKTTPALRLPRPSRGPVDRMLQVFWPGKVMQGSGTGRCTQDRMPYPEQGNFNIKEVTTGHFSM
jgi:hypothetical protein